MRSRNKPQARRLAVWLLAAWALLAACTKPVDNHLITTQWATRNQGGEYHFKATFDTTASYTLRLAARVDAGLVPEKSLLFDIRIARPDGSNDIERVELSLQRSDSNRILRMVPGSGSMLDVEWPWRTLRVSPGTWDFYIRHALPERAEAIYGLGFSYTLNDGKR